MFCRVHSAAFEIVKAMVQSGAADAEFRQCGNSVLGLHLHDITLDVAEFEAERHGELTHCFRLAMRQAPF